MTLLSTCPVSSAPRLIAIVAKRATMPLVMSIATDTAVPCTEPAIAISRKITGIPISTSVIDG
ncbi:hypothetical protein GCM10022222_30060 [Amycolatopsis ultiminotia]|uniref:Uncharacterized protein n=1 Tax=Amycolatopsis ultiminotia TaxID=543629 RepID=A0ABP6W1I0_9PSEU